MSRQPATPLSLPIGHWNSNKPNVCYKSPIQAWSCIDYFKKTKNGHDLIPPVIMSMETQHNCSSTCLFMCCPSGMNQHATYTQTLSPELSGRKTFVFIKLQAHRCSCVFQELKSRTGWGEVTGYSIFFTWCFSNNKRIWIGNLVTLTSVDLPGKHSN